MNKRIYEKNKPGLRVEIGVLRDKIVKLKGGKCYFCGKNTKLKIHHITYKNNNLQNLTLLCSPCHSKLHGLLHKYNNLLPGASQKLVDTTGDLV